MHDARERFNLTLEALPDSAPAAIRLRRWLKMGLRAFGLRCIAAVELHDESEAPTPATDASTKEAPR